MNSRFLNLFDFERVMLIFKFILNFQSNRISWGFKCTHCNCIYAVEADYIQHVRASHIERPQATVTAMVSLFKILTCNLILNALGT
jgi:hypothetical protein